MNDGGLRGADSFPRQHARTRRFTLGEPRNVVVSADGSRVLFARSAAGDDPVNALWVLDVATGSEHVLCDPRALGTASGTDVASETDEERRRRERARESADGVVSYAADAACRTVAFCLAGHLVLADAESGTVRVPAVEGGVFDPRPSPDGSKVAFVRGGALWVLDLARDAETCLARDDDDTVTWGLAEFVAAEEMGRQRGHWWSPGGDRLAACRVDVSPVPVWHIADPAEPASAPAAHRYPAAGGPNASVHLWILDPTGGTPALRCGLGGSWEYLCAVNWCAAGLLALTQSRDQRNAAVARIDPGSGSAETLVTDRDATWVELVAGTPAATSAGAIVTCADRDGARRLMLDDSPVTPADLQVRSVAWVGDRVAVVANPLAEPRRTNVWVHDPADGSTRCVVDGAVTASATFSADGTVMVVRTAALDRPPTTVVHSPAGTRTIASNAETPLVAPNVALRQTGARRIETAICVPNDGGTGALPVIFNPYGGPHGQYVVEARNAYLTSQWLADQGFVVVIADGRGTPGRGSEWERAVSGDLATCVLEDQLDVLAALPALEPRADTTRVAIVGWSFGGYLAALAVLRAPDRFHCAVAGAPVCDWSLYDTHYTERYLGHPDAAPGAYARSSLIDDAPRLARPLLLIHGLADDNDVAAHTLRMSAALLAAGKPHEVLPLSGVTHMTPQEVVAENLLLHEVGFIRRCLGA